MKIYIDDILIKKVFKANKTDSPELIRIYYIIHEHLINKSGLFDLDALCDVLASHYGYKSLAKNQGGNRSKTRKRIADLIRTCPLLFRETKKDIFCINSKYKITNKKISGRAIDPTLLHKKNKGEFYDIIIGVIGDGYTVDYKTLAKKTGYTEARICQAAKQNHSKGHIYKINNEIVLKHCKTRESAMRYRMMIYKQREQYHGVKNITHIVKKDGLYLVVQFGANSYTSDVMLQPLNAHLEPITTERHESKVFEVIHANYKQFKNLCRPLRDTSLSGVAYA